MNQGSVECLLAATAAAAAAKFFLQPINFLFFFVSCTHVHSFPRQFIKAQIIKRSTSCTLFFFLVVCYAIRWNFCWCCSNSSCLTHAHKHTQNLISFGTATDSFLICRTVCVYALRLMSFSFYFTSFHICMSFIVCFQCPYRQDKWNHAFGCNWPIAKWNTSTVARITPIDTKR